MSKPELMKILKQMDKHSDELLTYQDLFQKYVSEIYDLAKVDTKQLVATVEAMSKKGSSKRHSLVMVLLKGI